MNCVLIIKYKQLHRANSAYYSRQQYQQYHRGVRKQSAAAQVARDGSIFARQLVALMLARRHEIMLFSVGVGRVGAATRAAASQMFAYRAAGIVARDAVII